MVFQKGCQIHLLRLKKRKEKKLLNLQRAARLKKARTIKDEKREERKSHVEINTEVDASAAAPSKPAISPRKLRPRLPKKIVEDTENVKTIKKRKKKKKKVNIKAEEVKQNPKSTESLSTSSAASTLVSLSQPGFIL
mmetsp:Transcript_9591/g.14374  ORF Transcript_9591/g.14374 Transcript_9591/m.14374 type:complete len:137 (+) Transcript_9591:25-435(+)